MNTFKGTSPVQFGQYLVDRVSKDGGLVTAKFYQLSGCCTVLLSTQLRDNDNRVVQRYVQDTRCDCPDVIETNQENPFAGIELLPEESNFNLGERVKCDAYQVEGIVSCIAFYPDNSTHIEIQPPYNKDKGSLPNAISVVECLVVSLENVAQPLPDAAKRPSPGNAPMSRNVDRSDG